MRRWRAAAAAPVVVAVALAAGCGGGGPSDAPPRATLTVFAAASLRDVFERLADRFEADHPGVTVRLSFAGSSDLAAQLQQGAPADVLASADTATMDRLVADGLVAGDPAAFATNTLEIAVPPGNPAGVATLADLAKDGVRLVVCAPQVPCGRATVSVAAAAGLTLHPVSEEQSVTDVLGKVTAGEADAGLVYVTDVLGAGEAVEGIPFPESRRAVNTYPIAVLAGAAEPALARQLVDLVRGPDGQAALTQAGFATP